MYLFLFIFGLLYVGQRYSVGLPAVTYCLLIAKNCYILERRKYVLSESLRLLEKKQWELSIVKKKYSNPKFKDLPKFIILDCV